MNDSDNKVQKIGSQSAPGAAREVTAMQKVCFSAVIICFVFFMLEISCRLSPFSKWRESRDLGSIRLDSVFHHTWVPNYQDPAPLDAQGRGGLRINSQGWVEQYDISPEKPADCYRIFYTGDSNTQGLVPFGQKMPDLVEAALSAVYQPAGLQIEVVNTGTSSYSPLLIYLLIREKILDFAPDLIILNLDMTDVVNDAYYSLHALHDTEGRLVGVPSLAEAPKGYVMTARGLVKLNLPQRLSQWLQKHSALFFNMHKLIVVPPQALEFINTAAQGNADWMAHEWDAEIEKNVEYSMHLLAEIKSLLDEHNIDFLVTGVPHHPQFTGEWSPRPHQAMAEAAQHLGFSYFDSFAYLLPLMKDSAPEQFYYADDPTHLNAAGNRAWAEVHIRQLLGIAGTVLPSLPESEPRQGQ